MVTTVRILHNCNSQKCWLDCNPAFVAYFGGELGVNLPWIPFSCVSAAAAVVVHHNDDRTCGHSNESLINAVDFCHRKPSCCSRKGWERAGLDIEATPNQNMPILTESVTVWRPRRETTAVVVDYHVDINISCTFSCYLHISDQFLQICQNNFMSCRRSRMKKESFGNDKKLLLRPGLEL